MARQKIARLEDMWKRVDGVRETPCSCLRRQTPRTQSGQLGTNKQPPSTNSFLKTQTKRNWVLCYCYVQQANIQEWGSSWRNVSLALDSFNDSTFRVEKSKINNILFLH